MEFSGKCDIRYWEKKFITLKRKNTELGTVGTSTVPTYLEKMSELRGKNVMVRIAINHRIKTFTVKNQFKKCKFRTFKRMFEFRITNLVARMFFMLTSISRSSIKTQLWIVGRQPSRRRRNLLVLSIFGLQSPGAGAVNLLRLRSRLRTKL